MRQRLIIDHNVIASGKEIDVTDTFLVTQWAERLRPDYIVNCSAFNDVDGAEEYRGVAQNVNTIGPMNVAIAARLIGCKALHFSTDYVFDGSKSLYNEMDLPNPLNWYGRTKYDGENRFCAISNDCFVIRTSWLFAEHGNNFVKTMIRLFSEQKEVHVVNDQIGRPTYVPHLANIATKLLIDPNRPNGVWHVTNSENASWYQFAVEIYDRAHELGIIKKNVRIIPITSKDSQRKAVRPKISVLDTKRVEDYLGEPMLSWKQSLQDCLHNMKV